MSFRSEVRKFMQDVHLALVKKETIVQEQSRMILVLQAQNKDLLDRLMARDYPELATYTPVNYRGKDEATMDFEYDENLAGAVVDGETMEETE